MPYPDEFESVPDPTATTFTDDSGFFLDEVVTLVGNITERIQAAVGLNPEGAFASAAARLSDIEADLAVERARIDAIPTSTPTTPTTPTTDIDFFVDSVLGSDSNNGTAVTTPWATLAKVNATTFSPGQTIGFARGSTWREKLTPPSSGTSGNPITFTDYGTGPLPTFKGDVVLTNAGFSLTAAQVNTYEHALTTDPGTLFMENGVPLVLKTSIATVEATAGTWWWDTGVNKVYVHSASNTSSPITNGRSYSYPSLDYGINVASKNFITLENICVEGSTTAGVGITGTSTSTTMTGVEARHNKTDGFKCVSTTVTNTLTDCQSWGNTNGLGFFLSAPTGTNTLLRCSAWDNGNDTSNHHGFRLENGSGGTVTATECVSFNNASQGFHSGASTALTYARCRAWKNINQAGFYFPQSGSGSNVYHCVSWGNKYGLRVNTNSTASITVAAVKNSIFSDNITDGVLLSPGGGFNAIITSFLNNDVHGNASNYTGQAATVGLINGSTSTPTGSNGNLSIDPVFVAEAQRDFRLKSTSSLINAGVVITGYHDVAGVGYQASAPDISYQEGSYELGYVSVNEGKLWQLGAPYRYVGTSVYQMNSTGNYCGAQWGEPTGLHSTDLAVALDAATPQVIRGHVFQSQMSTPVAGDPTGVRNWAPFDHTISVCKARGIRLIAVLTDQQGGCEEGGYKSREWYESAWRTKVDAGNVTSHEQFIRDIVDRYKDEPTILSWEPVGEPEVKDFTGASSCSTGAGSILRTFFTDVSTIIRSIDSNHMIGSCVIGGGQCGIQGSDYQALHALSAVDYATFHDYSHRLEPVPSSLFTDLAAARAVNKPLLNEEAGVLLSEATTTTIRSTLLAAKLDGQRLAGIPSFGVWNLQDVDDPTDYGFTPSDPLVAMLQGRQR